MQIQVAYMYEDYLHKKDSFRKVKGLVFELYHLYLFSCELKVLKISEEMCFAFNIILGFCKYHFPAKSNGLHLLILKTYGPGRVPAHQAPELLAALALC